MKIYLASKSPRRQELLKQIDVDFTLIGVDIDESVNHRESPRDYVVRMAKEKANCGWLSRDRLDNMPLLAADTSVVYQDQILGKPRDAQQAVEMLTWLSEKTHQVITSVAVIAPTAIKIAELVTETIAENEQCKLTTATSITEVTFARLSRTMIEHYVASGDCFDKAGSYGIQGYAARFVKSISGSYSGVVGLPLFQTGCLLDPFER